MPVFRVITAVAVMLAGVLFSTSVVAQTEDTTTYRRIPTQFIAALGDPTAKSGTGAETWGLWKVDPGPRGVWYGRFDEQLQATGGVAPAKWRFDQRDWWLDENGLIMEKPQFPVAPGKYVVTGDREVITVLTVHPKDAAGAQRWELENANLYDVTHLPCRSARYTPADPLSASGDGCSPASVLKADFPVDPGDEMPAVAGCAKQDYAVLFVIGVEVTD